MAEFYAHIREDGRCQSVKEHCFNVGTYASAAVSDRGLRHTAYCAGLLHDAGKCKEVFQEYLRDAAIFHRAVRRGSVNHTFAGVRYSLERWHGSEEIGYESLTAELLAFAMGAHHGLFDCVDEKRKNGFSHRCNTDSIDFAQSMENYFSNCFSVQEIETEFHLAVQEITEVFNKLTQLANPDENLQEGELLFFLGLLARLLLSSLIEGDRRDTAEFMNNTVFPRWPQDMRKIWGQCLSRVEKKLNVFPCEKPIDQARWHISECCASFAAKPSGIYRLNVPTGSGKTLSGLRYALAHANKWNKSRIFFISPLLSILDQNAKVIREFVGDESLIVEHHSNLVRPTDDGDALNQLELLTDTWNSPIVITTLVQFLNTLFSGKSDCIRHFHALCDSVIIIDEVQTVPNKMLSQFNLTMTFLSQIAGATTLLCSATQPPLEEADHPLRPTPPQIVPYNEKLWSAFRRTDIRDGGTYTLDEIPDYLLETLENCQSLLVVCNKKDQAAYLFHQIKGRNVLSFHLSASMCIAHRRKTLEEIQTALEQGENGGPKVLCISTQVVEAGVDISFQRVIRFSAGMDSIVQSAGRCNRHGESPAPQPVTILRCAGERLKQLEEIRDGQTATESLLNAYKNKPDRFDGRLDSDSAICYYYRRLYGQMNMGYQDFAVEPEGTLLDLLSVNEAFADEHSEDVEQYLMHQAFWLAGTKFQVFDENSTDVLVPYQQGKELREALIAASRQHPWNFEQIEVLLERAKPYTVSLYQYQMEQLQTQGALIPLFDGKALALTDGYYNEDTGFSLNIENQFWEVAI